MGHNIEMKLNVVKLFGSSLDCTLSFRPSDRTIKACQGFNLVLECSTEGQGWTVFSGKNLLNCSDTNNEIVLVHSRSNSLATCNNGNILGHDLPVHDLGNCSISLLCVMVSPHMAGKTITCAYDNGITTGQIGIYSIPTNITDSMIPPATGKFLLTKVHLCIQGT